MKFVQFADDTTIYTSGLNIDNLVSSLNIELNCVGQWLIANKLSLNILKSKYMLIYNRQNTGNLNILIRNNNLIRANEINFVLVIIDHKLISKRRIQNLSKRRSQSIGDIYPISNFIPYRIQIHTHFIFCFDPIKTVLWHHSLGRITSQRGDVIRSHHREGLHHSLGSSVLSAYQTELWQNRINSGKYFVHITRSGFCKCF